jgi:hypothetical protein
MTRSDRDTALESADTATRRRAQEVFEGPVIVEAGAGTGKTSILVARIVVWALGEGWRRAESRAEETSVGDRASEREKETGFTPPEIDSDEIAADVMGRIAAITFTDAAAAEMADRTGRLLVEIAAGDLPESIFADRLPADRELRRGRAQALIGALDRLQVRTIHAFCRGLLAQYPLEAGVHPGFTVDADSLVQAEVVREVVEGAIATAYGDPGDADFLELAIEGIGPSQIEEALLLLVAGRSPVDLLETDPLAPKKIAALVAQLDAAVSALLVAEGGRFATGSRVDGALAVCEAARATLAEARRAPIASVEDLAASIESVRGLWEEKLRKRLGGWRKGNFTASEETALDEAAGEVR